MLYSVNQYVKFIIKSTNQHGVHSPFVYDLVTKCFYDKKEHLLYSNILNYKKDLLNSDMILQINDLGAGSKHNPKTNRLVSEIAKKTGTTNTRAKLLYRITRYLKPNNILELGTSLGIATHAMQLGYPEARITTIEGCPNLCNFTKNQFKTFNINNINLLNSNFKDAVDILNTNTYNLIFFDGNHRKDSTLYYFDLLLKTATNDSVFIFDDIYWSKEMTEAWKIIKQHPKITVTIDTFFWGLVFFRKEQEKEHFTIRL